MMPHREVEAVYRTADFAGGSSAILLARSLRPYVKPPAEEQDLTSPVLDRDEAGRGVLKGLDNAVEALARDVGDPMVAGAQQAGQVSLEHPRDLENRLKAAKARGLPLLDRK
jgi:hypothetical protein